MRTTIAHRSERMKIAVVYDVIYPYVKGGVEKRVWELANRLSRRGHDVHLFGMKFWEGDDILLREGVVLHGVCPAHGLYANGRRTIREAVYFSMHLTRPLVKEKFDIIDCQQFPFFSCLSAKCVAVMKKTPLVITWHEVWGNYWYTYLGIAGVFGKYIEKLISLLPAHLVTVSDTTARNLASIGCKRTVQIIPNGVDLESINVIPQHGKSLDCIFIGRLIKEKHVDTLIEAWGILTSGKTACTLLIIGDGPERDTILHDIHKRSLDDRVCLMGFQEQHEKMIGCMKSAKVCVLPSTREGFGITALEALACGLPVVTINHPANAIRELITEGGNGFLCSLSARDLADTIWLALQNHAGMREACIRSAKHYDWNLIAENMEAYYKVAIEKCT